ncbi:LuxR C-terminal-related transcriptional regulator [Actinoplanes siamensis]|nr:LuxR C-terminal-related transcriptional regulator [Actinoplanes siamensis]
MPDVVASAVRLAVEISHMSAAAGDSSRLLDGLWEPLQRLVPFTAGWIGMFDPEERRHVTAAAVGHDGPGYSYLESPSFTEQVDAVELFRRRRPMCLRDAPLPALEYRSWAELWWPAGYREGLGVPLVTRDGRRLGVMSLLTDSPDHPSDEARDAIGMVAPMLTDAIDPMSTVVGLAALVSEARASVAVDRVGSVHRVPGLPSHPLLMGESLVVPTAVGKLADHRTHVAFLCPNPGAENQDDYMKVTGIACRPGPPSYLSALVVLSRAGDLHGLTRRELEVLGFLIDGRPNQHIASRLFITERTVAAHLEHIRAKFGAPSRTVAAVRSLHEALYIPHELAGS